MESLAQNLQPHLSKVSLFVLLAVVILVFMVVWLTFSLLQMKRRWAQLVTDSRGKSLETMLMEHLRHRMENEATLQRQSERLDELESKMKTTIRYSGLIRFDAFEDTGGQQSFALAFFDEQGDGIVMSSLYGREESRVFSKELAAGQADRKLTKEEQKAIEKAGKTRKSVVVR